MSDPRQTMLTRIDNALAGAALAVPATRPRPTGAPAADPALLLDRFIARLEALSATWELADNPVAARLQTAVRLQKIEAKRVLSWSQGQLPVPGLLDSLGILGIEIITPRLTGERRPSDVLNELEGVTAGLTGADAGIASSGSLILHSGAGRTRLAAHWPRTHIALLPVRRIHATLAGWQAHTRRLARPAGTAIITGPSRSFDIELLPALGVHGPRHLHVILIQDDD